MEHKELIDYLGISQACHLHDLAFEYACDERWNLLALVVVELVKREIVAIEMTPKEFKKFQKIEHKRKVETDAQEFAIPGLAKTILAMERRIAKLEKQLKTVEAQSRKTYAKMIGG